MNWPRGAVLVMVVLSIAGGCSGGSGTGWSGSNLGPGPSTPAGPAGPAGAAGPITPPATVAVNAPPALPTGTTASVPNSIAANCSVDVTAALQAWIASVPDNSTLELGKEACYRLDGTLLVEDRNRLLIEGNGATLKAETTGKRNRGQLSLKGGSDLTVRDLIVRGANPHAGANPEAYVADLEAQHAFSVHGVTDALLDHVQAYDLYGDFVYIGGDRKTPSQGVTVANSIFERSGRQGISITDATDVTLEANVISGVARSVFDIEPNVRTQVVENVHIDGNVTGPAVNFWFANKGGSPNIHNIEVSGNRMAAATGGLVFVYAGKGAARGPYLFADNQLIANDQVNDEGSSGAFFFTLADNVTVHGNTVQFPSGRNMPAVELRDAHHVVVQGNHFVGAGRLLIAGQGSSDYHVS